MTAAPVPRHSAAAPSLSTIRCPKCTALAAEKCLVCWLEKCALTWNRILTRSMGAVMVRDNAPAAPPATIRSAADGSGTDT